MPIEDVKLALGELVFQQIVLQSQVDALRKQVEDLRASTTGEPPAWPSAAYPLP